MKGLGVALALVLATAPARIVLGQQPPPADSTAPAANEAPKTSIDTDLEPASDGYTYNPAARRDPFVSLNRPVRADRCRGRHKPQRHLLPQLPPARIDRPQVGIQRAPEDRSVISKACL